jgi:hypothetical protein
MAHVGTPRWLNERQKALLRRIASGDALGALDETPLRSTAYTLSNRRLISTSKHIGASVILAHALP